MSELKHCYDGKEVSFSLNVVSLFSFHYLNKQEKACSVLMWFIFIFQVINKHCTSGIPRNNCHNFSCWWNRFCFLWCRFTCFYLLFWLVFPFWLIVMYPCFINCYETKLKFFWIALKKLKTLFQNVNSFSFSIEG